MGPPPNQLALKFGPYLLDLEAGELRRAGTRIRLQEKPLQLLAALAGQSGHVVTREELRRRLWPDDTFVDFETGLNTAVSKLRDALSDDAQSPRYIETLPRRGYRFLVPIERIEAIKGNSTQTDSPAAAASESSGDTARVPPADAAPLVRSWRAAQILALTLAICVGMGYAGWRIYEHRHVSAASETPIRSIAVLPFDNFSGDPAQDYFADGLTDELITDLAQLGSLRVTSRSSVMQYKGTHRPMEQIRRELHVDAVVEGSVIRSGDTVRVNAQLIETLDDRHLWAQMFTHNEEDIAALQDDVAQAVAERIEVAIDPAIRARLANAPPVKAEAYEAFLHGIYYLQHHSDADLLKGLDSFKQAAALDPTFAAAYAGMAQTYCLLGDYNVLPDRVVWPQAEMNAQRALALDDSLSRAHAALALALWRYEWNWKAADAEFQKALSLSPNDADTHHFYGLFLAARGDFAPAGRQLKIAEDLDPLSSIIRTNQGWLSYYQRDYPAAIADYQDVLQTDPAFVPAIAKLWIAYACEGKPDLAASELDDLFRSYKLEGPVKAAQEQGQGANPESRFRAELLSYANSGYLSAYERARYLALAGQTREAIESLQQAESKRDGWLVYAGVDPAFDPLRSSPQFQKLLADVGLSNQRPG
ncbi:MAG TPA: winged helix-turn-helix domain-containing protein [Methylomirabilota bacterium]|nr:winged helix-turn-helix domain-containing protein [Methylomirabilota bacterium]